MATVPKHAARPKTTRPFRIFTRHLKALSQFAGVMAQEQGYLADAIDTVRRDGQSLSPFQLRRQLTGLKRRGIQFAGASDLIWKWQPVLLVTFLETYLQDVLCEGARVDPSIMGGTEQKAAYADVQSARSLEALAETLRARWARNVIDGDGPTKLITRLSKMGARGFGDDTPEALEALWGVRHVVVHRSGFVTHDFLERHRALATKTGSSIQISESQYQAFHKAAMRMALATDMYFLKRWPELNGRSRRSTGTA